MRTNKSSDSLRVWSTACKYSEVPGDVDRGKVEIGRSTEISLWPTHHTIPPTQMSSSASGTTEATAAEGVERAQVPAKPRRRFVGTSTPKASSSKVVRRVANQIPDDILHDAELNQAINCTSSMQ